MLYADIIVDISHENLDKTYQYAIPIELSDKAVIGAPVKIPFGAGNRPINGYILGLSDQPKIAVSKIKHILSVEAKGIVIESRLIALAYTIRELYGGTMNDALRTVIPVKKNIKKIEKRTISLAITRQEAQELLETSEKKHFSAKVRLLHELIENESIDYDIVIDKLNIARSTITAFEKAGIILIENERVYRNHNKEYESSPFLLKLNEEQQQAADMIKQEYASGIRKTYLIHGVTGSGKTEVYLDVIADVVSKGKQAIMLIPEIALTFQTVMRFQKRFGDRVSFLHSRLSAGERSDQSERAGNGEIDVMIGPRSALFTPFPNLGIIIIDEEHEATYKSEQIPKYHAREVAIEYSKMVGASVVLGSATPSLESYYLAQKGVYQLLTLTKRAKEATMPLVHIVDLREELKNRNLSIFSVKLKELINDRLQKKQQIMLFLNRRGYAGFISCRSCGEAIQCPHCAVSLKSHNNGRLICHYCGYEEPMPKNCPKCGSKYIAAFGTGTQKVEALVKAEFPGAKILRMDADTTKLKDGHEQILSSFANEEADILVGTQMIVKGHDFPRVTLMGILAADMSLQSSDFRCAEHTFQLLAQAAGRSGRSSEQGEVVIQTYQPDHYSIVNAAKEDYIGFYHSEMLFRSVMHYPPAANILALLLGAKEEERSELAITQLFRAASAWMIESGYESSTTMIGPAPASLSKARDIYRKVLYFKQEDYQILVRLKNQLEQHILESGDYAECIIQFDFNPMNTY